MPRQGSQGRLRRRHRWAPPPTLAGGGRVIGVIPGKLFAARSCTRLPSCTRWPPCTSARPSCTTAASGFALPGGLGTLDELCEVATWAQLGLHAKAVVLVDVDGFWDPFVAMLDRMVESGFRCPATGP